MDTAHMLNVGQGTNLNYYQNQYLGGPHLQQEEEEDDMQEERKSLAPHEENDDEEDEDQEELDDQVNEMSFNENTH